MLDSGPYIASARRLSLALVGLGIVSWQLGYEQAGHILAIEQLDYLFAVFSAREEAERIAEKPEVTSDPKPLNIYAQGCCCGLQMHKLEKPKKDDSTQFLSLPVAPDFFVRLIGECRATPSSFFLLRENESDWAVVLTRSPFPHGWDFGPQTQRGPWPLDVRVSSETPADMPKRALRLWTRIDFEQNFKLLGYQDLEWFLHRIATSLGVSFDYDDNPLKIVDKVNKAKPKSPKVLGLEIDLADAGLWIPGGALILAFLIWHRLRRVLGDPQLKEPWLMLSPTGYIEKTAAWIWAIALVTAPFAGFRGTSWVGGWPAILRPRPTAVALTALATIWCVLALLQVRRINREQALIKQHRKIR